MTRDDAAVATGTYPMILEVLGLEGLGFYSLGCRWNIL